MKSQSLLLLGVLFALLIAVFAVINIDAVTVNYFFGQAEWPLVLVIIFSVLMGGIISFLLSLMRMMHVRKQNKLLVHQIEQLKKELQNVKEDQRAQSKESDVNLRRAKNK